MDRITEASLWNTAVFIAPKHPEPNQSFAVSL